MITSIIMELYEIIVAIKKFLYDQQEVYHEM